MKIYKIQDVEGFFSVLDKCKGVVELITTEGDRLNLKSKLSQYLALSKMFKEADIENIELIAHEPEDVDLLFRFIMQDRERD
ncbi:hypothetical protein [Paenibacillus wynnii]|uniref:Polya polymerase n=1 Tax=Paenibacillus wynnii TaxID=268407 RepID=A0A098M8U4_9BACL|nr:hypothetical protein [Paenibacillus wynnii]KGE18964.1 polya polymerase [Paenibacillus wynnii]MDQ0195083.1 hypothetical protein [Paenibacillus wynnii]